MHPLALLPLLLLSPATGGSRLSWCDVDGDGLPDALALAADGEARLLVNTGDGTLVDATQRAGLSDLPQLAHAAWRDLDGDGERDLLAVGERELLLRLGDGRGAFTPLGEGVPHAGGAFVALQWLDLDGDGRDDLHLATGGGDALFRVERGGQLTPLALPVELGPLEAPRVPAARIAPPSSEAMTSGGVTSGSVSGGPFAAAAASGLCAATIVDSVLGGCMNASAVPALGALMPLSIDFNVDAAGNVGMGTTTPAAKLDVVGDVHASGQLVSTAVGGAPLSVASSDLVAGLNADLLDGLDASAFSQLGNEIDSAEIVDGAITQADLGVNSVDSAEIASGAVGNSELATGAVDTTKVADGTLLNSDISGAAAIAGFKVVPDFGAQDVATTGSLSVAGLRTGGVPGAPYVAGGFAGNDPGIWAGATIAGGGSAGTPNTVIGNYGTVSGGTANTARDWGTVSGGADSQATGLNATVGGGWSNRALGAQATVGGGRLNDAFGEAATVPGGRACAANGDFSLAAGRKALASHAGSFVWADSTDSFFSSSGVDQFLVRAGGGVGINTTSPEGPLHVYEGSAGAVTANANSIAVLERSSGGFLSILGPNGSSKGILFGRTSDNDSGGIVYDQASVSDESMQFRTGGNSTKMTILSSGNIGIGTNFPAFRLHVNGSAGKPGGGSWSVASDARLKRDVAPLCDALERLLELRGVTYEYVDPEAIGELDGPRIGMIAQEVERVFPDWVEEAPDGYRRLTIRGFEALTVEALRELRAEREGEVEALMQELGALRARVADLERALATSAADR